MKSITFPLKKSEEMEEKNNGKNRILWIIPAYNEARSIPKVVEDILSYDKDAEYVIISDGSTDETVRICAENGYSYIALSQNLGLTACFQTGMRFAYENDFDFALQFDGDGQHRAEDVGFLLEKAREGVDIVCGSRFLSKKKGMNPRDLGSALLSFLIFLRTGQKLTDPTCGLRLYGREAITRFSLEKNFSPEPDTLAHLLLAGMSISEVPVLVRKREEGESYLKPLKAIQYMARVGLSILFFGKTK